MRHAVHGVSGDRVRRVDQAEDLAVLLIDPVPQVVHAVGHPGFVGDLIRREDQVMARKSPYSAELRRRAVVMVADVRSEYDTEFAAITSVARQLGIGSAETLRKWVRQAEVDAGKRPGTSREEAAEIRTLKRRVAELERVNEILRAASSYFARELDFRL